MISAQYTEAIKNNFMHFFTSGKDNAWRVICIDYKPLTVYHNTLCYGIMEYINNRLEIRFKPTAKTQNCITGVLRKNLLNYNSFKTSLNSLHHYASKPISDINIDAAIAAIPLEVLNLIEKFESNKNISSIVQNIYNLADLYKSTDLKVDLEAIVKALVELENRIYNQPDTFDILMRYIEMVGGNSEGEYSYINILEACAVNIVTPAYKAIVNSEAYDAYMFDANYELLALYTSRLSRKHCSYVPQDTYASLTEFVPIAMKFANIYNPIFDSDKHIWERISKNYRFLKYTEVCDSKCSMMGIRVEHSDAIYDPNDPNTSQLGRIYYGLCCDVNEAFNNNNSTPIVPERNAQSGILYSTYLAAAIMYRVFVNEGYFAQTSIMGSFKTTSDASDNSDDVVACSTDSNPLTLISETQTQNLNYQDLMITKAALASSTSFMSTLKLADLRFIIDQMQTKFKSIILPTLGGII